MVAVAQVNGNLQQFVSSLKKKKKPLNVNMLRDRGHKGGVSPRKQKPTQAPVCRVSMPGPAPSYSG